VFFKHESLCFRTVCFSFIILRHFRMNFWLKENILKYLNFFVWLFLLTKIYYECWNRQNSSVCRCYRKFAENSKQQVCEVSETFGHLLLLCGERWWAMLTQYTTAPRQIYCATIKRDDWAAQKGKREGEVWVMLMLKSLNYVKSTKLQQDNN
jgi:hypothetical protein